MTRARETKRVQLEANGPDLVRRIRALNSAVAKIAKWSAKTEVLDADYDEGKITLLVTARRLPKVDRAVTLTEQLVGDPR